jgi:hypothetical protein
LASDSVENSFAPVGAAALRVGAGWAGIWRVGADALGAGAADLAAGAAPLRHSAT